MKKNARRRLEARRRSIQKAQKLPPRASALPPALEGRILAPRTRDVLYIQPTPRYATLAPWALVAMSLNGFLDLTFLSYDTLRMVERLAIDEQD